MATRSGHDHPSSKLEIGEYSIMDRAKSLTFVKFWLYITLKTDH